MVSLLARNFVRHQIFTPLTGDLAVSGKGGLTTRLLASDSVPIPVQIVYIATALASAIAKASLGSRT